MAQQYDLIVVGGGPGGYSTAAEAAAKGLRTALVERDHLGGTCLNRGCIPTKVICHGAEAGQPFGEIREKMAAVMGELREGVATILKDVEVYHGNAIFVNPSTVAVEGPDMTELTAGKIVVATGSRPAILPIPGAELAMTSDELLNIESLPASLAIIGGGVIGMEFASALSMLGVKVTVIEYCPEILPGIDGEIAKRLRMALRRRGIDFHLGAGVTSVVKTENGLGVEFTAKGKAKSVEAEAVLMAVGRKPVLPQGLAETGINITPRGFIEVDPSTFQSSVEGIYAIGDVNGRCLLAHAAEAQGKVLLGQDVTLDAIPAVCFTNPAVATVGQTAEALRALDIEATEHTATFRSNGYAMAIGQTDGMVKIVAETATGRIRGVHICGPHAADLIAEGALAVSCSLTLSDLRRTVHAHPTLAETLASAAR